MIQSYQDLLVWQRVGAYSRGLPGDEGVPQGRVVRPDITDAESFSFVASNIAEGHGRGSRGEYKHFLAIARGSTLELQTQQIIANELSLIASPDEFREVNDLANEVSKMLRALLLKL